MFIRTKLKANNKISVQIVESIRYGNKVSQRIICHIGAAETNTYNNSDDNLQLTKK